MPCYEVRTYNVNFNVENIDLLKRALRKMDIDIAYEGKDFIEIKESQNYYVINLKTNKIESLTTSQVDQFANSVKRAYSEVALEEVAKKNKWILKKQGQDKFQLVRY